MVVLVDQVLGPAVAIYTVRPHQLGELFSEHSIRLGCVQHRYRMEQHVNLHLGQAVGDFASNVRQDLPDSFLFV
mgnify:CR=1 FL=1